MHAKPKRWDTKGVVKIPGGEIMTDTNQTINEAFKMISGYPLASRYLVLVGTDSDKTEVTATLVDGVVVVTVIAVLSLYSVHMKLPNKFLRPQPS